MPARFAVAIAPRRRPAAAGAPDAMRGDVIGAQRDAAPVQRQLHHQPATGAARIKRRDGSVAGRHSTTAARIPFLPVNRRANTRSYRTQAGHSALPSHAILRTEGNWPQTEEHALAFVKN